MKIETRRDQQQLKALGLLQVSEKSVARDLLSWFCDESNLNLNLLTKQPMKAGQRLKSSLATQRLLRISVLK